MIRRVRLCVDQANTGKIEDLTLFLTESRRVINTYISLLWDIPERNNKFVTTKTATWLSARMQQALGKQALEIVRSCRKKRNTCSVPELKRLVVNLDTRFTEFYQDGNSFDFWIKLTSLGNKLKLVLPAKKHRMFTKYVKECWLLKQSIRLLYKDNHFFIEVFFEKEAPPKKVTGKAIGLDCGYKKLAVTSDSQVVGTELPRLAEKVARKQPKSKAFYRALKERDYYVNRSAKQICLTDVRTLAIENLKNVKHGTKQRKTVSSKFMNKLQRWTYSRFIGKLKELCEVGGVHCYGVSPAYTSQTCSRCRHVDSNSRNGEKFLCTACSYSADADYNASQNILMRFLVQENMVPVN